MKRALTVLAVLVSVVILVGWVMLTREMNRVDAFYSSGVLSGSSEAARESGVLVARPVVTPSAIDSGAVDLRVVDAWVEHPSHARYRWGLLRRVERDSTKHRLVVRHVHGPHAVCPRPLPPAKDTRSSSRSGAVDSVADGSCVTPYTLLVNGLGVITRVGRDTTVVYRVLDRAWPDTVRLSVMPTGPG